MSSRHSHPRGNRARGQGLLEFALVSPLILLLMIALFDLGRVVINYTTLTNASRAAARVAIVNQSNSTVCSSSERLYKCVASEHAVGVGIGPADVPDAVVTGTNCLQTGRCDVTVTLSQTIDLITPLIGSLVGPFNLSASTTMPIERTFTNP